MNICKWARRYVRVEDRKRALVSRLLQYALVHQVLAIPYHQILINRTSQGKPYLVMVSSSLHVLSSLCRYIFVVSLHTNYGKLVTCSLCHPPLFQECGDMCLDFPNFNFNVSHHGDYVAIASEPLCLVGVDIVSIVIPQGETLTEFLQSFSSYFSSFEWQNICAAGSNHDMLIEFYRYPSFSSIS